MATSLLRAVHREAAAKCPERRRTSEKRCAREHAAAKGEATGRKRRPARIKSRGHVSSNFSLYLLRLGLLQGSENNLQESRYGVRFSFNKARTKSFLLRHKKQQLQNYTSFLNYHFPSIFFFKQASLKDYSFMFRDRERQLSAACAFRSHIFCFV